MNEIISQMCQLLKDSETLLEAELQFETWIPELIQDLFRQTFERIDQELVQDYKERGYEIDKKETRYIQFSFGNVELPRRRMRKKGVKSVIPLDEAFGLKKHRRHSPLVEMKAAQMASDETYRKAAEAINLLTPIKVSHTTVHTMAQKVGQSLQQWTEQAPQFDETPRKEKKQVPLLFIEGDGLMLSKGREDQRPEIHRVQFHEGVRYEGKQKRPVLKNAMIFESTESNAKAFNRAHLWMESMYDLRQTIVISNSDGGSGYGKNQFDRIIGKCRRHEHCRDMYHVNEKIKQRLYFDVPMQGQLKQAIRLHDKQRVQTVLTTIQSRITHEAEEECMDDYEEDLRLLSQYLQRNWDDLKPLTLRGLPDVRGIGVCESNHRPYSYRMKRQGRGFSAYGAGNIAAIISARKNGTFVQALTDVLPGLKEKPTREFKGAVKAALKKVKVPSIGVQFGKIANYSAASSPMGRLEKMFR